MTKREVEICKEDWDVTDCGDEVELQVYSLVGYDFSFRVPKDNFTFNLIRYALLFDPDAYAAERREDEMKRSCREIIADADTMKGMLLSLAQRLVSEVA